MRSHYWKQRSPWRGCIFIVMWKYSLLSVILKRTEAIGYQIYEMCEKVRLTGGRFMF